MTIKRLVSLKTNKKKNKKSKGLGTQTLASYCVMRCKIPGASRSQQAAYSWQYKPMAVCGHDPINAGGFFSI